MKLKDKKCKNCGELFTPYRPLSSACSVKCGVELSIKKREAKGYIKQRKIKRVSDKLSKELKIYDAKRIIFLAKNTQCFAKYNGCFGDATDIHHSRGRGKYLNDITTWLPLCRSCHNYIELHPKEAKERGYSKNRLCE